MLNYASIRKVSVNNKPYYLHTDILKKMPFFDDFVKNTDEEINITLDNVDDKAVAELFDYLYKSLDKNKQLTLLDIFKVFALGDYFCIDIDIKSYYLGPIDKKQLLDYAVQNNQIEQLEAFGKKIFIGYRIFDFGNLDFEIIKKLQEDFYINEINYILDNKCLNTVLEIFETKNVEIFAEDSVLFGIYPTVKECENAIENAENDSLVDFYKEITNILDSSPIEIKKKIFNSILEKGKIMQYYYKYQTGYYCHKKEAREFLYDLFDIDEKVENNNQ